ncbi:2'-5'-oligoadenylate synthase 3-like isoform X2 [Dendronephthya gigantea]|uniref:2'-5'-oligoadenylate synthase 3-like isoform X2 n=1 Tax=Dendronephthya gigantea TaxID=151771 RepID=UPI00106C4ADF|nr:2'-5'-oligoadenylate synthase 3-like isoform X2 [Dendronephthya gigantea]
MVDLQCQVCYQSFSRLDSCCNHVHTHNTSTKSCVVRGCRRNCRRLSRHLKGTHRGLCEYSCVKCSKVFVRECDLNMHLKAKHSGEVLSLLNQRVHAIPTGARITVDFHSPITAKNLNKFISETLQPTKKFNKEMKKIVKLICDLLQKRERPDQNVKGGSQGKGTAVKEYCDIDLVMILNDVKDAQDLQKQLPKIKEEVKEKLRRYASAHIVPNSLTDTTFSVKFSVQGTNGNIDVDLLPTFKFEDLQDLYQRMLKDMDYADYYSAALVQQQVDFVEEYPPNVKNLIRLVKYWKKEMVEPSSASRRIPNSYLMELITIHLWEENTEDSDGKFDTLKAFHGVMEALMDYESLNVIWTENYSENDIPSEIKDQRPLVMDPANPTNNVCENFEWEEIKEEAKRVLASPMMRGVSSTTWK